MGYYTDYEIEVTGPADLDSLVKELQALSGYEDFNIEDGIIRIYEVKWYDNHEHMEILSAKHPHLLFLVSGDGEEHDDYWKSAYCDSDRVHVVGKVSITYPDIDLQSIGDIGNRHPEYFI